MDVETALREIDEAHRKHVGGDYDETRDAYGETLSEVESLAGGGAVEDVTRYVAGYLRDNEEEPPVGAVEAEAAEAVRDRGGEVPDESRLGA